MAFFSIIIPTYNSSATIRECIESILLQEYTDWEVFVMDNLSSDNTLGILNEYADSRIKIIPEKDKGVYDAMNKGIKAASGEWLHFLGSDDRFYDKDVLSKVAGYISGNKYDFIYGDAYYIGKKCFHDGEFDRKKLFQQINICHQAIFYNKNIFARLGNYNLDFPINADWDMNLRCFSTPDLKIKYIPVPVVYYNDITGISDSNMIDINFKEYSGIKLSNEIEYHKQTINSQKEYINHLRNSYSYKIGCLILTPFRYLRRLMKR